MPIPKRNQGEQEQEYIGRCIKNLLDEYDQDQAAAICYQQLDIQLGMDSSWRKSFLNKPESTCLTQYRQPDIDQVKSDVKLK
jgi:hypothetical protein